MEIPILFESKDFLVINKPAGLVVHADGNTKEKTLVDWLLKKYPEIKGVGEALSLMNGEMIDRPGIVHRLDRETSGALIIAKNQDAFLYIKKQFQEKEISKKYHAILWGALAKDDGVIDKPIGRSTTDFRKWSAERGARGVLREAITVYRVLSRTKDYTFVEAQPRTGRTHQIRVHFKSLKHPVVGDKLYGPRKENKLGFLRHALHAHLITFKDMKGREVVVLAPYPEDFKKALSAFGQIAE